ncbi:MAG: DotI/IcmL family type IV secretion protein [Bdellovibrionales bacterium]
MNTKEPSSNALSAKVPKVKMPDLGLGLNLGGFNQFTQKAREFLQDPPEEGDQVSHLEAFFEKRKKLERLITIQNYIVIGLIVLIVLLTPVLRPIYQYASQNPDGSRGPMASMMEPNLTDQTIISWSATAITDILTFGFGDVDQRILAQRSRFTEAGWVSFIKGFFERSVKEKFQGYQLVLTTAPSDMPVIVGKGIDVDGRYKWVVEMPVVMNYATNNLVSSRSQAVIRLILSRVPTEQNTSGIGIDSWIVQ